MITNTNELKIRRKMVQQFIRADRVKVVFQRRTRVETAAKGWVWGPSQALPEQYARIVPAKRRYGDAGVNTEAGQIETWPYQLLGRHDMDIAKDDTFYWQGDKYIVKSIEQDREERTAAFITYYKGE